MDIFIPTKRGEMPATRHICLA